MELEQKEKLLENFKKGYFLLPVPGACPLNAISSSQLNSAKLNKVPYSSVFP